MMTRTRMKREIERMKAVITARGARVHLRSDTPLEVQYAFLREVMACPECGGRELQEH